MELASVLTHSKTKVRVSSVLSNNSAEFGKQCLFDGNEDTSWYSDQGTFQYIFIFFDEDCEVHKIEITCSGGFCPKSSEESGINSKKQISMNSHGNVYLKDCNDKQEIEIKISKCRSVKILMKSFYDLYGRVIVYDLKILGKKIEN